MRDPWRFLWVLGSSLFSSLDLNLHSWCFSSFGVEEGRDMQIGDVDVNGMHKWSLEQLLGVVEKDLLLLFDFNFFHISSICKS